MSTNSVAAYEQHAKTFLQRRDLSKIGAHTTSRWAKSLKRNQNVLEIACGGGIPVTQTLVAAGLNLCAIDSSPTLVATFKKRFPNIPVQCASALDSDFFDKKFDAAICIGLLFLLCENDQIKLLHRVADHLHPGASFLFTAPVETGTWTDVNSGHTCVSLGLKAYEHALQQSGFRTVDRYEDSGKNHYYEVEKTA